MWLTQLIRKINFDGLFAFLFSIYMIDIYRIKVYTSFHVQEKQTNSFSAFWILVGQSLEPWLSECTQCYSLGFHSFTNPPTLVTWEIYKPILIKTKIFQSVLKLSCSGQTDMAKLNITIIRGSLICTHANAHVYRSIILFCVDVVTKHRSNCWPVVVAPSGFVKDFSVFPYKRWAAALSRRANLPECGF